MASSLRLNTPLDTIPSCSLFSVVMPHRHDDCLKIHWTKLASGATLACDRKALLTRKGVAMSDEKKPPASVGGPNSRFEREPLLDSNQAAAILKVHPRTLQRLVHRGEITAVHVGKLWRFKPSALTAWIDRDIAS
jgi:excisionase family DNA binding protein